MDWGMNMIDHKYHALSAIKNSKASKNTTNTSIKYTERNITIKNTRN
jgi:hypothetical protein